MLARSVIVGDAVSMRENAGAQGSFRGAIRRWPRLSLSIALMLTLVMALTLVTSARGATSNIERVPWRR